MSFNLFAGGRPCKTEAELACWKTAESKLRHFDSIKVNLVFEEESETKEKRNTYSCTISELDQHSGVAKSIALYFVKTIEDQITWCRVTSVKKVKV